ncbi:MAG: IS4 family transposase [Steroidobacteraceae bacterium]
MNLGKTLFAQVMDFLPRKTFHRVAQRHNADHRMRTLSCVEQFRAMAFAQLTYRESLRDIEACLSAQTSELYHMGLTEPVARSTLADANERRDWRTYAEFAQRLIVRARALYAADSFGVELAHTVYALDATTIDLCLSMFPWARFRTVKAAVRLHTLLDLQLPEAGAFYIMDRGYHDLARLYALGRAGSLFVTRAKHNMASRRVYSVPVDRSTGLICDQSIAFNNYYTAKDYPEHMRRIRYGYPQSHKSLVFLNNHRELQALTICALHKSRWQVELFFKLIKQHLRIKRFYGTSENAVKTQLWIAVAVYVLVAIIKKELKLNASLHTLLQILSVTLFEKVSLQQVLTEIDMPQNQSDSANQLKLLDP